MSSVGVAKVSKGVRTDSVQRWKNHFARSSTSVCVYASFRGTE